jgi:nicotinamide-nucleotide amidase
MAAEIICVGTELLLGDIVNTNAQYFSPRIGKIRHSPLLSNGGGG